LPSILEEIDYFLPDQGVGYIIVADD